jgi:hypothetical protein
MTEDKIQRLRDAGISEEVIIDMMKKPEEGRSEGYIDPATPSSTFTQAQAAGTPTQGPEQSWEQTGTEAAMLLPYAGGGALGYYGLKKIGQGLGARAAASAAPAVATPPAAGPVAPVAPPASAMEPGGQQLKDFVQQRGQYARPTVPGQPQVGMPQTAGIGRDIATDKIIRETALQRVLQGMAPYLRAASGIGGIGGMLYSPGLNTGEAEQLAEYRRRTGQQP